MKLNHKKRIISIKTKNSNGETNAVQQSEDESDVEDDFTIPDDFRSSETERWVVASLLIRRSAKLYVA